MKHHLLISAATSNSGKTTCTLGLLRALTTRGYKVQPFKSGPDYIDPMLHTQVAGTPSINLDLFMSSPDHVRTTYEKYSSKAEISLVEGVMGLFDGYADMQGSSALLAEALDLPVILILNARSTAYSVAPLLYGFVHFYPKIKIAGVIFNFVQTETHYAFLKKAAEDVGVVPLGYLARNSEIEIPSRHLGLSFDEQLRIDQLADRMAEQLAQTVDLDLLLARCQRAETPAGDRPLAADKPVIDANKPRLRISVARDEAFNFTYQENIAHLRELGEVTFFSPLHDEELPPTDFLYLPGGYPELHLTTLSENHRMLSAIRAYGEEDGIIYAECGGMIYLSREMIGTDGVAHPLVGLLPQSATMEKMRLTLGYRLWKYKGETFRGHEFHYSHTTQDQPLHALGELFNARGGVVQTPIIRHRKITASYIHFYWAESPFIERLLH